MTKVRDKNGIWLDTSEFRKAGIKFMKDGYYCDYPERTDQWFEFWKEERRRCLEGYCVNGECITGDHYFYLNYAPIQKVEDMTAKIKSKKITGFPDFWDGDYDYFWSREIARNGITEEAYKALRLYTKIPEKYLIGGKNMIVGKARRRGYEQPYSEKIMTPDGYTTMGEIKVGDEVLTPNGKSIVTNKYEQGVKNVYLVTLFDGRTVTCGEDHLWKVYSQSHGKDYRQSKIVTTEYLLSQKLKITNSYKNEYQYLIPINEPIECNVKKELPLPAYTVGAFLGDGNTIVQTRLSGVDDEIFEHVLKELSNLWEGLTLKTIRRERYWEISFIADNKEVFGYYRDLYNYKKIGTNRVNPLYEEFQKLGINVKDEYKFIPEIYKYNSTIEERWDLVRGLLDTDGSITKHGDITFCSISKQLCSDLQEVLYSLGITSTLRKRSTENCYVLYINDNGDFFHLKRKKERLKNNKRHRKYIAIVDVKKLDYQEQSACIEIEDKEHLYLTKSYIVTHNSYKAGAITACNYFHRPNSLTILGAEDKKHLYPNGLFSKTFDIVNFVNTNTAWTMPNDVINKISQGHIRASYIEYVNGVRNEKGFKSEILSLTFKDNPDAARGKDAYDVFFEESGAFGVPGLLKSSYNATKDTVMAGPIKTGLITVFGTSGDMESGSVDYANMFNNPLANDFLPFYNVCDDKLKEQLCGFFHPINLNMEGYYDENGNSDLIGARERELKERKILVDNGSTSTDLNSRMQEKPLTPAEAFSTVSKNIFPVVELKNQLDKLIANDWQRTKGTPVNLIYEDGKIIAKPILNGANPITTLYDIPDNVEGNVMIYEHPIPDPPRGLYKIGYDPVRQDDGTSLSAIIVYKGVHKHTQFHDIIVAEYIGRTETPEETDRIALNLADFYNTQIMYENEIPSVRNYFRRIKRLDALALQPDHVISKSIKKSKTARVYGCHMTPQLKDAGERYIQEWLLSTLDYDEHGNKILVIDKIYSRRLLEELIHYNRKGNFDLISALIMAMFQVQEETLDKEYDNQIQNKNAKEIIDMMYQMYNPI